MVEVTEDSEKVNDQIRSSVISSCSARGLEVRRKKKNVSAQQRGLSVPLRAEICAGGNTCPVLILTGGNKK